MTSRIPGSCLVGVLKSSGFSFRNCQAFISSLAPKAWGKSTELIPPSTVCDMAFAGVAFPPDFPSCLIFMASVSPSASVRIKGSLDPPDRNALVSILAFLGMYFFTQGSSWFIFSRLSCFTYRSSRPMSFCFRFIISLYRSRVWFNSAFPPHLSFTCLLTSISTMNSISSAYSFGPYCENNSRGFPRCSPKAVLKSLSDSRDNSNKASKRLLLPEALTPAITVNGENSISKF